MDDTEQQRLRLKFQPLLDPSVDHADLVHDVPAGRSIPEVRRDLRKRYDEHPGSTHIELRVGGVRVGVTSRARVFKDLGKAGGEPGAGDGDRATQPGESNQYRVLTLTCGSCGNSAHTMYYDERTAPTCCTGARMRVLR